jgi:hypothetical protein
MTVQQVEDKLGKPLSTDEIIAHPGTQIRQYNGDEGRMIFVTFEDGAAKEIIDRMPRRPGA